MKNQFIQLLERDHLGIKDNLKQLKSECESDEDKRDITLCRETFQQLKAAVTAHAKSEEIALYSLFEGNDSKHFKELKHFSLEGYKEHEIVDQLLHELNTDLNINDEWAAKFTVLRELLEHHLKEEEEEFFPEVQSVLGKDALGDLAEIYEIEHAERLSDDKSSVSMFFKNRFNEQTKEGELK